MSPQLKKILKAALVAGLLVAFFFYVPLGEIYHAVLSADLVYFGLAVLIGFLGTFLSTLNTWILARRQNIFIGLWEFFTFNLALRFYSFFSPASAVSTAMRWHKLSAGSKKAEALSAIALTRLMNILMVVFLGAFWALSDPNQQWFNPIYLILLFILIIPSWLTFTRISPRLEGFFHGWAGKISNPWIRRGMAFLGRFFASIESYATMPISMLFMLGLINFGNELLGVVSYVLIARSIDIHLSVIDIGWLRAVAFLAALTPFTLFGGVGLREVTLLVLLSSLDIEPDIAAAFAFLVYARGAIFALLCGLIELVLVARKR